MWECRRNRDPEHVSTSFVERWTFFSSGIMSVLKAMLALVDGILEKRRGNLGLGNFPSRIRPLTKSGRRCLTALRLILPGQRE